MLRRKIILTHPLITIKDELKDQLKFFNHHDKVLEAQRIEQRTRYDLEMMQLGYTNGIENYSRHLSGRCGRQKHHRPCLTIFLKMPC